jgi:Pyruvate/2-oxoglutarate dehydrogenase complex, dehydrogenase (E1) component, eukaryotic type, beta subunit
MVIKLEEGSQSASKRAVQLRQAIRDTLAEEMRRDDRIIVLGEDVGKRGGVFLVTEGLIDEFGEERVIDTPLSEAGILGVAFGMALYGLKPVAEIQFIDFVWPGFDQLMNEISKVRYRSGGQWKAPVVVRAPYGGGIGGGLYHSQSPEAIFAHMGGVFVVIPSTPYNAKGLLRTALRGEDPVIYLEPKKIYMAVKEEVPDEDYTIPFGKARIVREGKDVTVVTYGYMVYPSTQAAEEIEKEEGISVEVIDLQSIVPFDREAILNSVAKTGRLIIVNESPKMASMASEISAFVAEKAIEYLIAPIIRVTGFDTPYPFAQQIYYHPDAFRIKRAIKRVMEWD